MIRAGSTRILAAFLLAVGLLPHSSLLQAQGASALRPGERLRLEGIYSVRQGANGVAIEFDTAVELLTASAVKRPGSSSKIESVPLLASTSIVSKFGGQLTSGDHSIDLAKLSRVPGKAGNEPPRWLVGRSPSGMGMPAVMASYVPLEDVLPLLEVEESTSERKVRQTMSLLGVSRPDSELLVRTTRQGAELRIERKLSVPEAGIDLGEGRKLTSFREVFRFDVSSAAEPGYLGLDRNIGLALTRRGFTYDIVRGLRLEAKKRGALSEAERSQLDATLPRIEAMLGSFEAPGFSARAPAALSSVLEGLSGQPFEGFLGAFQARYEKKFPKPAPRVVGEPDARVAIGRPAPDFVLRDLDGELQSFRTLTKGKPALLAFWGYG